MQKVQNSWPAICAQLNAKLRSSEHGLTELSRRSGINYFAVRRFRMEGVRNRGKNAEKLCQYFGIELEETTKVQNNLRGMLTEVLESAWDGSAPHAELIIGLIKSTEPFKVAERRNRKT